MDYKLLVIFKRTRSNPQNQTQRKRMVKLGRFIRNYYDRSETGRDWSCISDEVTAKTPWLSWCSTNPHAPTPERYLHPRHKTIQSQDKIALSNNCVTYGKSQSFEDVAKIRLELFAVWNGEGTSWSRRGTGNTLQTRSAAARGLCRRCAGHGSPAAAWSQAPPSPRPRRLPLPPVPQGKSQVNNNS